MGHNLTRELGNKRNQPKTSYAVESPLTWWPRRVHLLTSINWWSSQKKKPHTNTQATRRAS